jgi:carbon monoxide dehydrogenase subunit G
MLRMTQTVCIDAPADAVWRRLSELESIRLWVPAIKHSHCPGQSRGVGAVRVCELSQATIRETIVEWDEGRSFTYQGEGAPMMKSASNRWSVEARGGQTLVTTSAEVVIKGGAFGTLLQPLLKPVFTRLGLRSLATLKYFVENGKPYAGNARDLPFAPAAC